MMFSHRAFKPLFYLQNPDKLETMIHYKDLKWWGEMTDKQQLAQRFEASFKTVAPVVIENVNMISKPFHEAVEKSSASLQRLINDHIEQKDLFVGGVYMTTHTAVFCIVHYGPNGSAIVCYNFSKDGQILSLYATYPDVPDILYVCCEICEKYGINTEKEKREFCLEISKFCIKVELFKIHATIETVVVEPGKKASGPKGEKCKNETLVPVTMLDTRWFTTTIRTDGFPVRGHVRLQPIKENGEWKKRLIWINEFEKNGYTRKALKQSGEELQN